MTKSQFLQLCHDIAVDPDIALENDNLRDALQSKDDKRVVEILVEEF
tara:strand:+ start:3160 stop:3300 length:141 start_codon:yes stop_codon:yes gene_type:complete